jgi:hypothetical protein
VGEGGARERPLRRGTWRREGARGGARGAPAVAAARAGHSRTTAFPVTAGRDFRAPGGLCVGKGKGAGSACAWAAGITLAPALLGAASQGWGWARAAALTVNWPLALIEALVVFWV